jgi:CheY-like chemotaxis protein
MLNNKPTVLIVDDTETNIDVLLDLLNDYDVIVAISGQSALEVAYEENPDLILLDIMMPVMDGYEVCEKLKNDETTKNIPVVFITAKTDEDSIERAYEVGGIDYVTKPFKPRELLARVKI